jgi:UDP-GlcNAc:undecaprenyl-phosphate/decaprenyl-phosphate GlcNAc-1-phosphate transferase
LDLFNSILSINIPHWTLITLGFIVAFCLTGYIIPSIVKISRAKGLCDFPNGRTSHSFATPTFGRIAVFIGFVLAMVLVAGSHSIFEQRYIFAGLIIIFFIGVKDDILVIDPMKKLAGQIIAASILVLFANIRITNLFGIFQIGELPYILSLLLTVFVFIVIINGFNLIDGIDGLAAGTGIVTSSVFAFWFWDSGDIAYAIFCFSFMGSMTAFFIYNVFGSRNKIFLGDTGSMLTGFILSILTCHFLQGTLVSTTGSFIPKAPALVIGILIIPLYDSLRVFVLRISKGKSPFKADKQHLHHRLLELGFTHLSSTLIMITVNICFIIFAFSFQLIGSVHLIFYMLGIAIILSTLLVNLAERQTRKRNELELLLALKLKNLYRRRKIMLQRMENIKQPVKLTKEISQN